jgi:hypothetical protein
MMGNMPGFDQGYAQGYRDGYLAALSNGLNPQQMVNQTVPQNVENGSPKRRKVGKYQKTFGRNLKALKKKHPRTQINTLMKRAHRMTRRDLK